MYLLKGQTLDRADWFMPEGMPLQLQDSAISTASVTVGPQAPEIAVGDWLLDDSNGPGGGIVWRVKGLETNYGLETRTATLEHVLATLQDGILSGEHNANAMGGRGGTCTARQALEYALRGQGVWALGDCEFDRTLPYTFNNTSRYQAVVTVCGTLSGWCWEYDLTRLPFVLHVRRQSDAVGSELRMGRNLASLKVTLDRSQMYTRFYPVGARNRRLPEGYVEKNTAVYGVIEHTATDQSMTSDAMMRAWAEDLLSRHAEPSLSIAISALELSAATGEPLDNIRLGMVCRVPLPRYGTVIRERVTRLQWADALRDPVSVSVTLANSQTDVASIIQQMAGGGSRNAGGAAAAQEEDHAWIVDTTDHVGLVAEAIVGRDGETVDWSRVSSIIVDGEGIHQRVVKAEGEIVTAQTAIEMNENAITLEARRAQDAEGSLQSSITVEAGRITSLVTKTGVNSLGEDETMYTRITQTERSIQSVATRVTANENGIEEINRTAVIQNSDHITQVAGKFTVNSSGDVRLVDGASLAVYKDGVLSTVGTVREINSAKSDITGSALWQNRDSITAVAGKFTITSAGNVNLENGASLRVYENGVLSTVGTVTRINDVQGQVSAITGTQLWQTRDSITAVAGRFKTINNGSDISLIDGAGIYVQRDGVYMRVADKGNVTSLINQTADTVLIQASKINLSGYVTATDLSATNATIDNLVNGRTTAESIRSKIVYTNRINIGGYAAYWQKINYVASASITLPSLTYSTGHYFLYAGSASSSTPSGSANGRVVTGWSAGSVSISGGNAYFLLADHEDN